MDIEKLWNKALKNTEIIRSRIRHLNSMNDTDVPYILLSESSINEGDTIVRQGKILVKKPSLIIPPNSPQFNGFDFDKKGNEINENSLINFLLVRGISLPSLNYDNKINTMDIFEGKLSNAITKYKDNLQQKENVHTGLIAGPEDCWQFSLLIFVCMQIARNADADITNLIDEYKKRHK